MVYMFVLKRFNLLAAMPRCSRLRLRQALILTACLLAAASNAEPRQAKNPASDLQYGQALYFFYQQAPLQALTQLAIKELRPLISRTSTSNEDHDNQTSNASAYSHQPSPSSSKNLQDLLLETALKLDYQMSLSAKALLTQENLDDDIKNSQQLWLYLAQRFYQKQLFDAADYALKKVSKPETLQQQSLWLYLNLQMQLKALAANHANLATPKNLATNNPDDQLSTIDTIANALDDQSIYRIYALNNIAMAHYQNGNPEKAGNILDEAIKLSKQQSQRLNKAQNPANDKSNNKNEAQQLLQRLLTSAAFMALYQGQNERAKDYFSQLEMDGLFIDQALLGFGQLAAKDGNTALAMRIWQASERYPLASKSKIKALTHLALLQEQQGQFTTALTGFENVDRLCTQHLQQMDKLKVQNDGDQLLDEIINFHQTQTLAMPAMLDEVTAQAFKQQIRSNEFLLQLINNDAYLSLLQHLQDLDAIKTLLIQWKSKMPLYNSIINSKKQAFIDKQAWAKTQDWNKNTEAFDKNRQHFSSTLERIESQQDAMALLTPSEQNWQQRIQSIEKLLPMLTDDPFYDDYVESLRRIKGALLWQASENYHSRLWQTKKALKSLEQALTEQLSHHQRFQRALNQQQRFSDFEQRLAIQDQNISQIIANIAPLRQTTATALNHVFLEEWQQERQAILSLQKSSRIAIARVSEHFLSDEVAP